MTDDTRGAIVDLTLIGAASIAVYFIATNPPVRRMVWRALKYGLFTRAPTLLWQETTRAWALSGIPHSGSDSGMRNSGTNLES